MPVTTTPIAGKTSRRAILASAAALCGCDFQASSAAFAADEPAAAGLRDFAYASAALTLAAADRPDLQPLASIQRRSTQLFLTPDALIDTGIYQPEAARQLFANGARQVFVNIAASEDASQAMILHVVEGTDSIGADRMLAVFRALVPAELPDLITPDLAAGADNAYLVTFLGQQTGGSATQYHWLQCGARFGNIAVAWLAGFQDSAPDIKLAATVNTILRACLSAASPPFRGSPNLAFLAPFLARSTIVTAYIILAGLPLIGPDLKASDLERLPLLQHEGIASQLTVFDPYPAPYVTSVTVLELLDAERSQSFFPLLQDLAAESDATMGTSRRSLVRDEFAAAGWDEWAASAFRQPEQNSDLLSFRFAGRLGEFIIQAQVGENFPSGQRPQVPPKNDPDLRRWSDIGSRLLAPLPAASRRADDLAARAIFPEPLTVR